jgi:hypothetical protein
MRYRITHYNKEGQILVTRILNETHNDHHSYGGLIRTMDRNSKICDIIMDFNDDTQSVIERVEN